jgi:hypothetical protein
VAQHAATKAANSSHRFLRLRKPVDNNRTNNCSQIA